MPVRAEYSVKCDRCPTETTWLGDGPQKSRQAAVRYARQQGWKIGRTCLCPMHRAWPKGTIVVVSAGVNPIGQNKTFEGGLSVAATRGWNIWCCGHKHRSTGRHAPASAFACAKKEAKKRGWVVQEC